MDELAATANRDPYEFRLENAESPRMKAVLQLAAEKSNWAEKLPSGKGRGIACLNEFGTYVATVVELTVAEDGVVTVDRVTAAIDCGVAVNPRTVDAQISGAIVDGLSTALMSRITIANGGVEQSSFRDFQWFRMRNMPVGKITVHQIASNEAPGGIGEVGYPSTGPAVANAIFAATGKRLRRLPMQASDILDAK
jgi:isoquinoline 1-oxidoreductase beta subunit